MALITVITPTYNRANTLDRLYRSLQEQSSKNFMWLIVDDGSADKTEALVKNFVEEADFPIQYLKKTNGGKHTALNVGIQAIESELTFIVDSDDTVLPDGMATIEHYYEKYKEEPQVGVWSFLKVDTKSEALVMMPWDEYVGSYITERIKNDRPGDMAEVFFTKALKEFPFPEFPGEKFLSEDVVWIPLGLKYKTVFINKPIYQCEYLEDGLTRNDKKAKFASPLGSMMRGKMLMTKQCGWKARIKGAIIYNSYWLDATGNIPKTLKLNKKERVLVWLMQPLGRYFRKKWKK